MKLEDCRPRGGSKTNSPSRDWNWNQTFVSVNSSTTHYSIGD